MSRRSGNVMLLFTHDLMGWGTSAVDPLGALTRAKISVPEPTVHFGTILAKPTSGPSGAESLVTASATPGAGVSSFVSETSDAGPGRSTLSFSIIASSVGISSLPTQDSAPTQVSAPTEVSAQLSTPTEVSAPSQLSTPTQVSALTHFWEPSEVSAPKSPHATSGAIAGIVVVVIFLAIGTFTAIAFLRPSRRLHRSRAQEQTSPAQSLHVTDSGEITLAIDRTIAPGVVESQDAMLRKMVPTRGLGLQAEARTTWEDTHLGGDGTSVETRELASRLRTVTERLAVMEANLGSHCSNQCIQKEFVQSLSEGFARVATHMHTPEILRHSEAYGAPEASRPPTNDCTVTSVTVSGADRAASTRLTRATYGCQWRWTPDVREEQSTLRVPVSSSTAFAPHSSTNAAGSYTTTASWYFKYSILF
ncbi:hypothetical protein GGX14DRAFT_404156 [Mycena pura]|uniref:Uncharacterized protein n=1 Tax=Mycena pura TaxID=153505 RepID=A0AAD6V1V9_9AGAR|nr:hypothetical protein GGX14DRAFT_404156 [Mycena pura]